MPKITFLQPDGSGRTVEAPEHWSLMEVALDHKIDGIAGVCGGVMSCATCHVYVHPDWRVRLEAADNDKTEEEEDTLDLAFDVRPQSRLSCQLKISATLDGLVIALPGTKTGWD